MKALKYFLILGLLAAGFVSCKDDDDDDAVQIESPDDIPLDKAKLSLGNAYLLFPAVENDTCDFKVFKDSIGGESLEFNYEPSYNCYARNNDSLSISLRRSEVEIAAEALDGIVDEEIPIYEYYGCDSVLGRKSIVLNNGYEAEWVSFKRIQKVDGAELAFLFEIYYVLNDVDGRLYNVMVNMPYESKHRHYDYLTDIVQSLKFKD